MGSVLLNQTTVDGPLEPSVPIAPPAQESDLLPETNRFIPPKPGGLADPSLPSSANTSPRFPILQFLDLLEFSEGLSTFTSTACFSWQPNLKICLKRDQNPVLFGLGAFLPGFHRQRLDLTLPIQETLGEDGSADRSENLPPDPNRFGKNWVLPGLTVRRFLGS